MCSADSTPCPYYARLGVLNAEEVRLTVYVVRSYSAKEVVLSIIDNYERILEDLKTTMKNEGTEVLNLNVSRTITLYIDTDAYRPVSIPWEAARAKGLNFHVERSIA
jgi:hypothetical protein